MKNWFRKIGWKILGINYFNYLDGQHKVYLDKSPHVTLGVKTYHNGAFVWQWHPSSKLVIGKYCSIANDVNFILDCGYHLLSQVTNFPHFNHIKDESIISRGQSIATFKKTVRPKKSNIEIGNDVWIGMNAIILPGVKIGNGVTIMAGAVVSHDIPDYAIVGGVPGKIIRMKYEPADIEKMLKIAWWHWPVTKVENNWNDFYLSLPEFIDKWQ